MKKAINILYLLGWAAYIMVFIAKKSETLLPYFFQCYFADLLAIPLVLGATTYILKKYTSNSEFKLSIPKVLFACVYFSFLFEWILPSYSSNYTSDLFDVICYFIGGGIYYQISNYYIVNRQEHATTI